MSNTREDLAVTLDYPSWFEQYGGTTQDYGAYCVAQATENARLEDEARKRTKK